ncbi:MULTISPECIES: ParE family toxin-like protein [unclassified Serratia (in: enterobacteria)]|uniref:ParE family toxin-like protein n=1 Tax=unclassified Serratia (in: enterobacteria) TaxID=2647522 RepID=UPI003FA6C5BE
MSKVNFNNAPLWITAKALHILTQFSSRRLIPRRTKVKGSLTFRVNKRWRLLSQDGGKNWQLLTNNDYNAISEVNHVGCNSKY